MKNKTPPAAKVFTARPKPTRYHRSERQTDEAAPVQRESPAPQR